MTPDATQKPLGSPKPRRWYCRRGSQLTLLVIVCFVAWIAWLIQDANERHALLDKLQTNFNCVVQYGAPDWAHKIIDSTWLSQGVKTWLFERVRFPTGFEFEEHENNPIDKELLTQIALRHWPTVRSIGWDDVPAWNGRRLLLPMNCGDLDKLRLSNSDLTDETVDRLLTQYSQLYYLELTNQPISGHGLSQLHLIPRLEWLHLRSCKLKSLDFLKGVSTISSLDLSYTPISDEHLKSVQDCVRLQELYLQYTPLKGATLSSLQNCRRLKRLYLDHTDITDESMKLLPAFEELETLEMNETNLSGRNLFAIGCPPKLQRLMLNKTKIQMQHLYRLKGHDTLREFQFDGTSCSDEGCEVLSTMPSLWQISFNDTSVGDKTVAALKAAPKLSYLGLKNTKITDLCGTSIREMPNLATVDVENTAIGNQFFKSLNGHPTLTSICLRKTKANDQAVSHLLRLPHLVNIHISPEQFSKDAIRRLEERHISVNTLTDEEMHELSKYSR